MKSIGSFVHFRLLADTQGFQFIARPPNQLPAGLVAQADDKCHFLVGFKFPHETESSALHSHVLAALRVMSIEED